MEFQELSDFISSLPFVEETFPFGPDTLVYKIGGKMFLLVGLGHYDAFNAKCDPQYALELREQYHGVIPGYHMNKKHWNTVKVYEDVPLKLMQSLIRHSYDLVYQSLPKKIRSTLEKE